MPYTFILSDDSLNSFGFRVKTEGIDTTQFERNPIMLWMHRRAGKYDDSNILPIGRWENIRKENNQLLADAVFDEKDEFAKKIKDKVEAGILKMASLGFEPLETSTETENLLQGQTKPTVTKAKVIEASIVDIGGNDNALKLYNSQGQIINLALDTTILPDIINKPNNNKAKMKNIAIKLKLAETANEGDILIAIEKLISDVSELSKKNESLAAEAESAKNIKAETLVLAAIEAKKISADKKETFVKMAKADFDAAKQVIESMPGIVKPTDILSKTSATGTEKKKLTELTIEEIEMLKKEDLESYKKLYKAEYGIDYKA